MKIELKKRIDTKKIECVARKCSSRNGKMTGHSSRRFCLLTNVDILGENIVRHCSCMAGKRERERDGRTWGKRWGEREKDGETKREAPWAQRFLCRRYSTTICTAYIFIRVHVLIKAKYTNKESIKKKKNSEKPIEGPKRFEFIFLKSFCCSHVIWVRLREVPKRPVSILDTRVWSFS